MPIQFLSAFIIYLLTVLIIGIVSSKKAKPAFANPNNNSTDFILGNRSTNWFLTALSAHASDMSDWLFMGLPAAVYLAGGYEIWIPIGLLIGMFLCWHFIASPLRTETEHYNATTLASYFKNKFNDTSGIIVGIAALISFFFFSIYLSVGLKGIGYVLKSAFGLDYHLGIFLAVLVVLAYTLLGGFVSVAWIDLFQGTFLLIMLMFVPIYTFFHVGGWPAVTEAAKAKNVSLALLPDYSLRTISSIFLNPFAWCLGYFGMPHVLTKFMGAQNCKDMYKSKYLGLVWQFLATFSAIAVGLVGIAYFTHGIPFKNEFIFIEMTKSLFNPWLGGFILCAILAATISTVDSQLLVLAGIVAEDFYKNIFNKKATTSQVYLVYRIALVIAAIAGFLVAWNENSTIMSLVKYAWSGLGSAFGPLVIMSLYSKSTNKYGALAGILTGTTISIFWDYINPYITDITIYSIVPAYVCAIIAIYVVSKVTKR